MVACVCVRVSVSGSVCECVPVSECEVTTAAAVGTVVMGVPATTETLV